MSLNPDDPKLTAYLLGELPSEKSQLVADAAAANPALQASLVEIQHTRDFLAASLNVGTARLSSFQRESILRAARQADLAENAARPSLVVSRNQSMRSWWVGFSAAAAIALAGYFLATAPSSRPEMTRKAPTENSPVTPLAPAQPDVLPLEVALLPAPGPADSSATGISESAPISVRLASAAAARDEAMRHHGDGFPRKIEESLSRTPLPGVDRLPHLALRRAVDPSVQPVLELPVLSGRASVGWLVNSVREQHQLPPPPAVRIEEILNSFSLRPTGITAISNGVSLGVESISCPWKPSATLLLIGIKSGADSSRQVIASFHADSKQVRRYRLIGFSPVAGLPQQALPSNLFPKSSVALAMEIEPSTVAGPLGSIQWTIDGSPGAPISVSRHGTTEPSDDARFAALVCTYGQWLVSDPSTVIDPEVLAALNRENNGSTLPADRTDFIHLVEQSLKLSSVPPLKRPPEAK